MRKIGIILFGIVLMGIGFNPHVSFAEDAQDDGFFIAVNEDETLSDEEKFSRAHEGLEKALSLALEKVSSLKADLDSREFTDGTRELELKTLYLADLSIYETFYSESLAKAQLLESLESVQALAQEVKTYRDVTYTPGVQKIVEFILVFYSEDVINTAADRFTKISEDIGKLELLGLVNEGTFSEQLASINTTLTEAMTLRSQAKDMVLAITAVEEPTTTPGVTETTTPTVIEEETLQIDAPAVVTDEGIKVAPADDTAAEQTAQMLLEKSLNNVKSAYNSFIEISKSVKETLGLE